MNSLTLGVIAVIMMLIGFAGVVLPFIPGVPLAWLGLFIYAWGTGFEQVSVVWIVIFGILTAFTFVLDFIGPAVGASSGNTKGSKWAVIGSIGGAVLGVLILGPIGILLGPLLGAFIGEYLVERNYKEALMKSYGAFMGFISAMVIKIVVVIAMGVYFIFALVKG